jgi:hypothetical protein
MGARRLGLATRLLAPGESERALRQPADPLLVQLAHLAGYVGVRAPRNAGEAVEGLRVLPRRLAQKVRRGS